MDRMHLRPCPGDEMRLPVTDALEEARVRDRRPNGLTQQSCR